MHYRLAKKEEYRKLADIHIQAFDDFFLTSLGYSFLLTYYHSSLKCKDCVAVCACSEENEIVGFALGTVLSNGHHKRLLLSNLFSFSMRAIVIFITKPKAILRLYKNLSKSTDTNDNGQYAELLSIGVLNFLKGKGVGKGLIDRFEQELILRGCKQIALTTDYFNNDSIVNFYKKQGYNHYYDFVTYPNRRMNKMIKNL
jgi:ribosomal protein S18 acetylase RimI-like enzyme